MLFIYFYKKVAILCFLVLPVSMNGLFGELINRKESELIHKVSGTDKKSTTGRLGLVPVKFHPKQAA